MDLVRGPCVVCHERITPAFAYTIYTLKETEQRHAQDSARAGSLLHFTT